MVGNGPWGTRSWTYDTVGNRLSEAADGGAADTYVYVPNAAGNHSPRLDRIDLDFGGQHNFQYDPAGNQTQAHLAGNVIDRTYDAASRLSHQERAAAEASAIFRYDPRGFLTRAESQQPDTTGNALFCDGFESGDTSGWGGAGSTCFERATVDAIYRSTSELMGRGSDLIFHFAGAPIAQLSEGSSWVLFTVDHTGVPIFGADEAGTEVWSGGFGPFGEDVSGAEPAVIALRLVGQWRDSVWAESELGSPSISIVFRQYSISTGQYLSVDPLPRIVPLRPYLYAESSPVVFVDPFGLHPRKGQMPHGGPYHEMRMGREDDPQCIYRIRNRVRPETPVLEPRLDVVGTIATTSANSTSPSGRWPLRRSG